MKRVIKGLPIKCGLEGGYLIRTSIFLKLPLMVRMLSAVFVPEEQIIHPVMKCQATNQDAPKQV